MNRMIGFVVACVAAIGLAACAAVGAGPAEQHPGAGTVEAGYRLGANDKLRVIVFNEPTLSGEFAVSGTGVVSYPLVGDIPAAGKTVTEFQTELQRRLSAGYLRDPRVSVEVMSHRPFYILGEVNRPGEYPYANDLTVLNAVATAQGFTYRADTRRVFVRHAGETTERVYSLNSTTPVLPGDTIRIGERFF